jgi:hypothetical protein
MVRFTLLAVPVALALSACGSNVQESAASGAGAGIVAGALVGGPIGAIIGGAIGGAGGMAVEGQQRGTLDNLAPDGGGTTNATPRRTTAP